jgi:hypothetical protein
VPVLEFDEQQIPSALLGLSVVEVVGLLRPQIAEELLVVG